MKELEGPRELKDLAEYAHDFVRTYMNRKHVPQPPVLFFVERSILMPDPKNREDMIRVTKRFLEMAEISYAHCFIARLWNEDGDVVHEDALMAIASDGQDLTYHISLPFSIERKEEQVVAILWDEENKMHGWQSRSANRAHMQTLSPQQQRMLDYIKAESGMENQPLDLLRMIGLKIVPYPIDDVDPNE